MLHAVRDLGFHLAMPGPATWVEYKLGPSLPLVFTGQTFASLPRARDHVG
jgi:hypothetical protein